jgi:hypothetical protein
LEEEKEEGASLSSSFGRQSTNAGARAEDDVGRLEMMKEDFWREMERSEDPFETVCFYISKGYLGNV